MMRRRPVPAWRRGIRCDPEDDDKNDEPKAKGEKDEAIILSGIRTDARQRI
jgi:hypothetical protein